MQQFLPLLHSALHKGQERSRDVESILAEVRDLHDRGYKEVTLLGQNVNSYGLLPNGKRPDNGVIVEEENGTEVHVCSFANLLRTVAEAVPDMRVRFTTSNPEDMSEDILHAIADEPNLCHHIHFPAQSGSNKVLHDMNRKYTRGLSAESRCHSPHNTRLRAHYGHLRRLS